MPDYGGPKGFQGKSESGKGSGDSAREERIRKNIVKVKPLVLKPKPKPDMREVAIKKYQTEGLKKLGTHRKKQFEGIMRSDIPFNKKIDEIKKKNLGSFLKLSKAIKKPISEDIREPIPAEKTPITYRPPPLLGRHPPIPSSRKSKLKKIISKFNFNVASGAEDEILNQLSNEINKRLHEAGIIPEVMTDEDLRNITQEEININVDNVLNAVLNAGIDEIKNVPETIVAKTVENILNKANVPKHYQDLLKDIARNRWYFGEVKYENWLDKEGKVILGATARVNPQEFLNNFSVYIKYKF